LPFRRRPEPYFELQAMAAPNDAGDYNVE
jgi:hypothetical protein